MNPWAEPDPDGVSHWQTIVDAPYFEATPQPEAANDSPVIDFLATGTE